jgi:inner membrane protein
MDLFTHFLVPYIILTAVKSKNKLAGAFGGISPDFDTIFVAWIGILSPNLFIFSHRGITHSFIFGFITSTIFLYVISRKQVNQFIGNLIKRDITVKFTKTTIAIAYFGVLTHLFLDYLTTLGIPLFFPFSITRYALNLYQSLDIITIILAAVVMIIIYLKVNYKYKKAAMAIFMIILILFGGLRAYEKVNILDNETPTLTGNYTQLSVYPTSNILVWNVVKSNSQNSSYIVSQYNGWSNQESNIQIFNTPSVENGNYSAGLNAIKIADTLPVVKQFKWNSYYTVVNAKYNSTKWDVTYSDIINSYTANNITVTVP